MIPEFDYIYTLYEEGSFSKAAEKLFVTQPALSIAVRKVEERIGMPVFDRNHRPLTLTPAGEAYIDMVRNMKLLSLEFSQKINDLIGLDAGIVRIGGSHYINSYILAPYLSAFSRKYPKVELRIIEKSSFELCSMLRQRQIDIAFSCDTKILKDFVHYPMFCDNILLAVPEDLSFNINHQDLAMNEEDIIAGRHLCTDCHGLTMKEIADLEIMVLSKGNNLNERVHEMFREEGLEPRVKLELNQLVTAYHLAASGLAATFISDRLVIPHSGEKLAFYPLANDLSRRNFHVILNSDAYIPIAVQALVDMMIDTAETKRI